MKAPLSPLTALALSASLAACSSPNRQPPGHPASKSASGAAPTSPQPAPEPKRPDNAGPEIVELSLAPDELLGDECVSDPIEGGVLDQTSSRFSRIEVKTHPHFVEQRATLVDGHVVIAHLGGCERTGVSYTVVLPADRPPSDREHHVGAALDVVKALPVRAGARHYKDEIEQRIRPALSNPGAIGLCVFPTGVMAQVACDVTAAGDQVRVRVAYEIQL